MTEARKPADSRRIAAALANPDVRRAYAEVVLGQPADEVAQTLNPARRSRVLQTLLDSGLVERDGDALVATDAVFRELLAQQPPTPVAQGVDRFLRPDGTIDRYPAAPDDRRELLVFVAERVIAADEVLSEPELNERLTSFSADFALLRRYLVDYGILERSPSGSSYSRTPTR